jgi:hypothetical protein
MPARRQHGLTLIESAIAISAAVTLSVVAMMVIAKYSGMSRSVEIVMQFRDVMRVVASEYAQGRDGYPGGTRVATHLANTNLLPAGVEATGVAGEFSLGGQARLRLSVPVVGTALRGNTVSVVFIFPIATPPDGPCVAMAKALKGWAVTIAAPDASPTSGGQPLAEPAYTEFWTTRCGATAGTQIRATFH